ncbi:replication initiator [Nonomuraea sp. NPDC004702]
MALRRRFARLSGLTVKALREQATIAFAKVAEYQRRGVAHFHAVIRFDGPDGPNSPPPAWATADALSKAVQHAATVVTAEVKPLSRTFRWGTQLDVRRITMDGDLTEQAVAAYIAKYATKAAECVGTLDRRIQPLDNLDALPVWRTRPVG